LKALGKSEVSRRSEAIHAALAKANPAPIGSDEWAKNYRAITEAERDLRAHLPVLHKAQLDKSFVVEIDLSRGSRPYLGGYVFCVICGSASPSIIPKARKLFWAGCECGNIKWRCIWFWRRCHVRWPEKVIPVKLFARAT